MPWRIVEHVEQVSTATVEIVKLGPSRYYLCFAVGPSTGVVVSTDPSITIASPPSAVNQSHTVWELDYRKHGDLVRSNWYAVSQAANDNVRVIEMSWID